MRQRPLTPKQKALLDFIKAYDAPLTVMDAREAVSREWERPNAG